MMENTLKQLAQLCEQVPAAFRQLTAAEWASSSAPGKWTKQQILGHLIDSATNNHQRFVRAQFEENPTIGYDQNGWNAFSYYDQMPIQQLMAFWHSYNVHLLTLWKAMPLAAWARPCTTPDGTHTLSFIAEDYVAHMKYHLKQILPDQDGTINS